MVVKTSAIFLLALALLTLPLNWLAAFALSASVHELSHYLALRLLGIRCTGFTLGPAGAVMNVSPMSPMEEILCALAGPLGGLCLLPLYRVYPRLAICAGFHSAFNLLPIRPLDGGRALHGLLAIVFPESFSKHQSVAEVITCAGLLWVSLRANLGIFPLFFALLAIARAFAGKRPCKLRLPGVQ